MPPIVCQWRSWRRQWKPRRSADAPLRCDKLFQTAWLCLSVEVDGAIINRVHSASSIAYSKVRRHALVAEFGPGHFPERWQLARHLVEQAFGTCRNFLARDKRNQFTQKFPFRPGVAARLNRLHELLH